MRDPTAGNTPKAHNSFARGAGFPGHRAALEPEIQLLTAAAKDKYKHADRLRGRLHTQTEKATSKRSQVIGAKVKAIRETLQKANAEDSYFERQALSAQRLLAVENVFGEFQDVPPSPSDTLTELLADFSQDSEGPPLPSDPSPPNHVCETDTVPSVSPLTPPQPQSGASSRLSTEGGTHSAFDSASAPRPKRSVRIAGSPAATQPRRRSGSPRTSSPRRPAQPVSPQRRRTTAVQSKKAPVKGKVRVKAIRKR